MTQVSDIDFSNHDSGTSDNYWKVTELSNKDAWYVRYPGLLVKVTIMGSRGDIIVVKSKGSSYMFDPDELYLSEQAAQDALDIMTVMWS